MTRVFVGLSACLFPLKAGDACFRPLWTPFKSKSLRAAPDVLPTNHPRETAPIGSAVSRPYYLGSASASVMRSRDGATFILPVFQRV